MEIKVSDDAKIVEVWLTNAEKDDPVINEQLKPLYKKYHEEKYTVAVFRSGPGDLEFSRSALLHFNLWRNAEKSVLAEKQRPNANSV